MEFFLLTLIFIVAAVVVVVIIAKKTASHKFKCRHCSEEFRIEWSKVILTEHSGGEYKLVCPFCKVKDWCTEHPNKG